MRIKNKIISTVRKEGFFTAFRKGSFYIFVNIIRSISYNKNNIEKWKELKDKFKKKRVFLIGNGPSLNRTELYLLKNEYKICFNRINVLFERLNWYPNFYACIDKTVLSDNVDEIKYKILPNVDYAFFPELHKYKFNFFNRVRNFKNVFWLYYNFEEFGFNLPWISKSPTVATAALQILPYLGFTEIYLVGVDMNYKIHSTAKQLENNEVESQDNDDPNHFDPRYFGKGRKYHQPTEEVMSNIFESIKRVKKNICKTDSAIYNATYGGRLELFERVEYKNLFNYSDKEKFELFSECFSNYYKFKDFDEMKNTTITIDSIKELESSTEDKFLIVESTFLSNVTRLLENYIPFGPYLELFFLVKRKNENN